MTDQQAIDRYKYMLKTAPPEAIEQAHEEAFAKLTPEQRRALLEQLASETPRAERESLKDDPQSLARAATRAEIRQPGFMERVLGGVRSSGFGGGLGLGGIFGSTLLASFAGTVIGSAVAQHFFDHDEQAREVLGHDDTVDETTHKDSVDNTAHEATGEGSVDDLDTDAVDDFDGGDFGDGGDLV